MVNNLSSGLEKTVEMIDVLIVDDHRLLSETLAAALELSGGFRVDLAVDFGGGLLAIRERGRYNVVLLDYQLPGIAGLLGLQSMVSENEGGVALFSGVADWHIVKSALDMGAQAFIPKTTPFSLLVEILRLINMGDFYLPPEYCARYRGTIGAKSNGRSE